MRTDSAVQTRRSSAEILKNGFCRVHNELANNAAVLCALPNRGQLQTQQNLPMYLAGFKSGDERLNKQCN